MVALDLGGELGLAPEALGHPAHLRDALGHDLHGHLIALGLAVGQPHHPHRAVPQGSHQPDAWRDLGVWG